MRALRNTIVPLALLVAVSGGKLEAQRIGGTVRDSGSAAPLAGAVVVLLDRGGGTLARTLSDAAGRYVMQQSVTAAEVRVIRIGFQPRVVPLPLTRGNTIVVDVAMSRIPPMLAPVEVSSSALCSDGPDRRRAAAFWEQARAGLLAAVVAREATPAFATLLTYTRMASVSDGHVLEQETRSASGTTTRPFAAADSPRQLAERGYIDEDSTRRVYKAPDADVLLDESFAETHCFEVKGEDSDHPGAIGLAFEPAQGRDSIVDVRGVLWMDAGVLALRSMEFQFTQLEPAAIRAGAGGALRFHAMPNGVVFIDRWSMRLPVLKESRTPSSARIDQMTRGQDGRSNDRRLTRILNRTVVQMTETGGLVLGAVWRDSLRYRNPPPVLTGSVWVERSSTPLPGVVVSLMGTGDSARTDSAGRFAFQAVIPGRYTLVAADTAFAEYSNVRETTTSVIVQEGSVADATLQMPSRATTVSRLCDGQRVPDNTTILFGKLVADVLFDFHGLSVSSNWLNQFSVTSETVINRAAQLTDVSTTGRFRVCGIPEGRRVQLTLRRNGHGIADTSVVASRVAPAFSLTWPVIRSAKPAVPPPERR